MEAVKRGGRKHMAMYTERAKLGVAGLLAHSKIPPHHAETIPEC